MSKLKPNEFQCDHCLKIFTKGRSDETADQEANRYYPTQV